MADIKLKVGFDQSEIDNEIKRLEREIKSVESSIKFAEKEAEKYAMKRMELYAEAKINNKDVLNDYKDQAFLEKQEQKQIDILKNKLVGLRDARLKAMYEPAVFQAELNANKKIEEQIKEQIRLQKRLKAQKDVTTKKPITADVSKKDGGVGFLSKIGGSAGIASKADDELGSLSKIGGKAIIASKAVQGLGSAFTMVLSVVGKLASRIFGLIKNVLLFSVISMGLRDVREYIGDVIASNDQLSNSLLVVKSNLATAFSAIYTAVLPALQTFIDWLGKATAFLAAFIARIFGSSYKAAQRTAKSFNKQSTATKNLTKETKKLGKEMEKVLASFDELNVLSNNISDNLEQDTTPTVPESTPESTTVIPVTPEVVMPDYSNVIKKAEEAADKLKQIFSPVWETISGTFNKIWASLTDSFNKFKEKIDLQPLIDSFGRLKESLQPFTDAIGDGLKWFIDEVLAPFAAYTINELIPNFLDLLSGALDVLNPIIEAGKDNLKWFWDNFLDPIVKWGEEKLTETLKSITDFLKKLGKWLGEHKDEVDDFVKIVFSFAAAWALVNGVITAWNIIGAIATAVTTAFGTALAFLTSPIGIAIVAIGALIAIIVLAIKHWDEIKETAIKALDKIKEVWGNVKTWFDEKVITPLKNAWSGFLGFAKKVVFGALKWIYNYYVGIINFVIAGFEKLANIVPEVTKFILKGLNWVIEKLNKLPGVNIDFRFNTDTQKIHFNRIPYLAQGAVIPPNREFLAVLGDQTSGTNIETPVETMKQAFRDVMEEFGNNNGGEYTFVAQIDGREIFRETVRQNQLYKQRIGSNAFA